MCALSALIEAAQLMVIPGRDATIGDVLTNSLGGALGFAVARNIFILLRPAPRMAVVLGIGWSAVWLTIQTASSFGFSPTLPRSEYYGQIARCLGNAEPFSGRVLSARIGDVVVPDMQFNNSSRVRDLLIGGATLTTTLSPPVSADAMTPIVRIADGSEREILVLAQNVTDMVFGVRTGAAVLRLRPPLFGLADVFPAGSHGDGGLTSDTVTVSARYSAGELWVITPWKTSSDRRIPITASLGWTLLMPFQWFIEGTRFELLVSAIWTACLLSPMGYWAARIFRFPHPYITAGIRMLAMPIVLLLLYLGLFVVPQEFGLSAAPASDWLAAFTGIIMGAALAPRESERGTKQVHGV
jgi:hypothetical protein